MSIASELLTLILFLLVFVPASASAVLSIDANVTGVYTDLTFTTPTSAALQDGFGNACDGDYDQDGYVLGVDVIFWLTNCSETFGIPMCDLRGNGTGGDFLTYLYLTNLFNGEIGPSALACATIPPVDVGNGDPACF